MIPENEYDKLVHRLHEIGGPVGRKLIIAIDELIAERDRARIIKILNMYLPHEPNIVDAFMEDITSAENITYAEMTDMEIFVDAMPYIQQLRDIAAGR